jgi:hypothetical protein
MHKQDKGWTTTQAVVGMEKQIVALDDCPVRVVGQTSAQVNRGREREERKEAAGIPGENSRDGESSGLG